MTPFRSEKNTNWEGAFRVPLMVRWPGKIPAGVGLERDRPAPRLAADVPRRGRRPGHRREAEGTATRPAGRPFKVHIDGYNLLPYLTGEEDKSPRQGLHLLLGRRRPGRAALRQLEGRLHGAAGAGDAASSGPSRSSPLRIPKLFNLRTDPFERADITSNTYYDWFIDNGYMIFAAHGDRGRSSSRRSRTSRRGRRRRASRSTRRSRRCEDAAERGPLSDGRASPSWSDDADQGGDRSTSSSA